MQQKNLNLLLRGGNRRQQIFGGNADNFFEKVIFKKEQVLFLNLLLIFVLHRSVESKTIILLYTFRFKNGFINIIGYG